MVPHRASVPTEPNSRQTKTSLPGTMAASEMARFCFPSPHYTLNVKMVGLRFPAAPPPSPQFNVGNKGASRNPPTKPAREFAISTLIWGGEGGAGGR